MAKQKLNRIVRSATAAEKRRHKEIRVQTDEEFAQRRKPVSPSRVLLAKLRSRRDAAALDCELVIELRESKTKN